MTATQHVMKQPVEFRQLSACFETPYGSVQQLCNELSHFRVLSIESKVRKLCITQGFTLGVKMLLKDVTLLWIACIGPESQSTTSEKHVKSV